MRAISESFLAHSPTPEHPDGQLLKEHLENVSHLAEIFCAQFGAEDDARLCGLYHDIGKYTDAFQKRLAGSTEKVDHSTAGALLLFEHKNIPAAVCIAGHHTGLPDLGTRNDMAETFMGRMNQAKLDHSLLSEKWRAEIPQLIPNGYRNYPGIGNYFYIKMLFSGLTDADWIDTESFFSNQEHKLPDYSMEHHLEMLNNYISGWWNPTTGINKRRCSILRAAIECGNEPKGLFTMTVPTGGGKTISSMAFALNHAVKHNMHRIIYVIPYCSILEQTREVFEAIFGKESVTAHYSCAESVQDEKDDDERHFSTENWEAPIVLTTAVQFFESIYSNKPGKNRKLHNIANSVVIFDEAQMLPVPFMNPCLAVIGQFVKYYNCSAVLCTATQPAVEPILEKFIPNLSIKEICPERDSMYQQFRRVKYVDEGKLTDEQLANSLKEREQVLCIVNSRRQAQELYNRIQTEDGSYHLSTMMTPHDRKCRLKEIRSRLQEGKSCRVISTSLIEAGVDVDFPEVFRAVAGLDSIIQAGGRCNREGKRSTADSMVHVFRTEANAPKMLNQNIAAAERTIRKYESIDSPESVHDYFHSLLYILKDKLQLDERGIIQLAEKMKFQTVAEQFRLIDGADYTIYIPVNEGIAYIDELRQYGPSRKLMSRLQEYSVNVYEKYFEDLVNLAALERLSDNTGVLLKTDLYSEATGLPFQVDEQDRSIYV